MADPDLYSIASIAYHLLSQAPDLSRSAPGFLTRDVLGDLGRRRGLDASFVSFLCDLAGHEFHTADVALASLSQILGGRAYGTYSAPPLPQAKRFNVPDNEQLAVGTLVAHRYKVLGGLALGGLGFVYAGEDMRTGGLVVLKVSRYATDSVPSREAIEDTRADLHREARTLIQMHERTGAVPQLLDVVRIAHPQLATHPDPNMRAAEEPVLVIEFVVGSDLDTWKDYGENQLLEIGSSLANVLARLHQPDRRGDYFLYVDWKPQNVRRHIEALTCTFVDLGSVVRIENGRYSGKLQSTDPYAALEEFLPGPGRRPNFELDQRYDLYGLGAVLWRLAQPDPQFFNDAIKKREEAEKLGARACIFDTGLLAPKFAELPAILDQVLAPEPQARLGSAREVAQIIRAAQGRSWELMPEPPHRLTHRVTSPTSVEITCEVSDPYWERLTLRRDTLPVRDPSTSKTTELTADGAPANGPCVFTDQVDPAWIKVHYGIFTTGRNGLLSVLRSFEVDLLADPESFTIERRERALRLTWEIPPGLADCGGEVVLERIAPSPGVIYRGMASEWVDDNLDPTKTYQYRIRSHAHGVMTVGVVASESPLPTLARILSFEAEAGNRLVTLRWTQTRGAADRIRFVRSRTPVGDTDDALQRAAGKGMDLQLDANFQVTGSAANAAGQLDLADDGLLHGMWVDENVRPGRLYYYTLLVEYRAGDCHWVGGTDTVTAYAEVQNLEVTPLPGSVRLHWQRPEDAKRVVVERQPTTAYKGTTWRLDAGHDTVTDPRPSPDGATYSLHVEFEGVRSAGIEVAQKPDPSASPLPHLLVLPNREKILLWCDFADAPGGRVECRLDGRGWIVRESTTAQDTETEVELPAWQEAAFSLIDSHGREIETVSTMAFAEVESSEASSLPGSDTVHIRWQEPKGCAGVLVSLAGLPRVRWLQPNVSHCHFEGLPQGKYQALVQTITAKGDLSEGLWSNVVEVRTEPEFARAS